MRTQIDDTHTNVRTAPIANPGDHDFRGDGGPLFLFSFGAYGDLHVYGWGNHTLEDALETVAEYLAKHAPGVFSPPDYDDAARDLGLTWNPAEPDERIMEQAEADLTYTESGWIPSWEWYVSDVTDPALYHAIKLRSLALGTERSWEPEP